MANVTALWACVAVGLKAREAQLMEINYLIR